MYIYAIISSARLAHQNKEYHLKSYNRWYWYIAIIVAISISTNVLFSFRETIFGYATYHIPAASMEPTLQVGDYITVDTRYSQPKLGDVVVFLYPQDRSTKYVKRVAALGGDVISIKNGNVLINGKVASSLSVPERMRQRKYSISMKEIRIPKNEIFVLGDRRDNSNDSRFWGTVPAADVTGKVTYIWYSRDTDRIGMLIK